MEDVPQNYKTAGILMLVSGIMNLLAGVGIGVFLAFYITVIAVSTFGLGIFCYVCCLWPLVPLVFGVFELIVGMNMMNGKPQKNAVLISILGIVVGALNLTMGVGIVPMIMEIVATVMLNDAEVKAWLEQNTLDLLE